MIKRINQKTSLVKKWVYAGIILIGILLFTSWKKYLRSLPQDYTVGEISRIYLPGKGGWLAVFNYSVSGERFSSKIPLKEFSSEPEVGLYFVIEYPEKFSGKFGTLRPDIPVENTIIVPPDGWDKLPDSLMGLSHSR